MVYRRSVDVEPWRDERNEDPEKNGGVYACSITFTVYSESRPANAVRLVVNSGWWPEDVAKKFKENGMYYMFEPMLVRGVYTLEDNLEEVCDLEYLLANDLFRRLLHEGSEAMFSGMEAVLSSLMDGLPSREEAIGVKPWYRWTGGLWVTFYIGLLCSLWIGVLGHLIPSFWAALLAVVLLAVGCVLIYRESRRDR